MTLIPSGTSSFRMSSKAIFHSRGPSTDPCGTPHVISFSTMLDAVCANTTQFQKWSRMILRRYSGTLVFASASGMRIHSIKLNAFWISRLMAASNYHFLFFNAASFFQLFIRIDRTATSLKPILVGAQDALPPEVVPHPLRYDFFENFPYRI